MSRGVAAGAALPAMLPAMEQGMFRGMPRDRFPAHKVAVIRIITLIIVYINETCTHKYAICVIL